MNHLRSTLVALPTGFLFGLGLLVSGMTEPRRVLGFLDVTGDWDATLLFVMAGAVLVHAVLYRLIRRRPSPLFAEAFAVPSRRDIDGKLLAGAALFGAGWGLSGYCPGPALVSLSAGGAGIVSFVVGMVAGIYLAAAVQRPRAAEPSPRQAQANAAAGEVPYAGAVGDG
ncbi:MAG TPA: DUF6691 family protein [Polyangiaceae bacterium]|nr:DUF6691 family protein [Polyangiaceae bacterium]